ncbi:uncharacterized protein LOC133832185 [Humulus lupulus]|uniref:uncharacterized protein LOC133832185 n=1 Tax=Humulus lupulus TaxID=3486 RepID=UPI002B416FE2|nr:uncharacterized protein LOC133832185 [Humulus lupulus]
MAIVAHFDLELNKMDVRAAFLNGDLSEDVYMNQPVGFEKSCKEHVAVDQITANNNFCFAQHQNNQGSPQSSIPGHIVINRDRENVDCNIFNEYFAENPQFNDSMFRRRFQMGCALFLHIFDAIQGHDNYFVQRRDGIGKLGLSGLQKVTTVFLMLTYGVPADATDEYIKIRESTALESLKQFCRAFVEVFGACYL